MGGSVLKEKSSFKIRGVLSLLNLFEDLTLCLLLKLPSKKVELCFCYYYYYYYYYYWSFFLLTLLFIFIKLLYTYIKRTCIEYCHCVWAGCSNCYLVIWDKLQKWICRINGPSLAATLDWRCTQVMSFL